MEFFFRNLDCNSHKITLTTDSEKKHLSTSENDGNFSLMAAFPHYIYRIERDKVHICKRGS